MQETLQEVIPAASCELPQWLTTVIRKNAGESQLWLYPLRWNAKRALKEWITANDFAYRQLCRARYVGRDSAPTPPRRRTPPPPPPPLCPVPGAVRRLRFDGLHELLSGLRQETYPGPGGGRP
jgi:hypothetical protein